MATTTIPWGDGSGDNIYLTYPSASGNQTVVVTSDANTGAARSKVVAFTSDVGNIVQNLTVSQVSGETPGGGLGDYVQDGLVLHMDGKYGKGDGTWTSAVGSTVFTNYGATFNSDNVEFDGSDDYLSNTSFATPGMNNGTIEVCYDFPSNGATRVIYMPKTSGGLTWAFTSSANAKKVNWSNSSNKPVYGTVALKGSASISNARAYGNGNALTYASSSYLSGRSTSTSYIGRRSNGYYYEGKIYSIRIYSRQLTEEEVLQNLAVDNIRFSLGLELE